MAIPKREQLANNAFSTLDGAINNSQTSFDVVDGSVFPSVGNFRIRVGDEIMVCTARSTDTLTVVRGQEGTAAASASNGADVVHILTAGGLTRWTQDNLPLFGYSSYPPLGKIVADDGVTLLTASSFTWDNQGSTTATDQNGTIIMRAPAAASENVRALYRSAPSTPYSYIAAFEPLAIRENFQCAGMGFRQNSSGKLTLLSVVADSSEALRVAIYKYTNATTFSARLQTETSLMLINQLVWFRIEDDGTNTKYYISSDGVEFIQIASESRTTFFTTTGPDQVWWGVNNSGSSSFNMLNRLHHWSKDT